MQSRNHERFEQIVRLGTESSLILQFFLPASRPVGLPQNFFSESDRLRRDFHQLVIGNPFDAFFEPHFAVQRYDNVLIAARGANIDRKSTRLNSSHVEISYAILCLKKKNIV